LWQIFEAETTLPLGNFRREGPVPCSLAILEASFTLNEICLVDGIVPVFDDRDDFAGIGGQVKGLDMLGKEAVDGGPGGR
jgi:hypothetical protein